MDTSVTTPVAGIRTTCPYCGVGCGVKARPNGSGGADISGDDSHPANFGRLCSKGSSLGETLGLETRLLHPQIGGARVSWSTALDHVASELQRIRAAYGPNAIAFYLSGQLLTEDYYVANKLAKGFIGTPNVDTNSRLCMASSVAGHKRAFGADVVPGNYEDLDTADMIVLAGSNAAWCHPILFQRIQKARQSRGATVVTIDPRRTATAEGSDLHLNIAPGSDTHLWNGLLCYLADNGVIDLDYISEHTEGFTAALAAARSSGSIATVAFKTGLPEDDVRKFYQRWAETPRVVSCYSQGVNQAVNGTDKVNAIINCHLATGRIGQSGAGPFSLTGQPNAMGGREVGGLANMLAAHMGFSDRERDTVGRFWRAPNLVTREGLKAVAMFDAIERGEIKALWVMGTNPAVSLPRADQIRVAMSKLDLCVISEVAASTDTSSAATVQLPAAGWGEKDGTVTNSERRISRQRAFLPLAGEARADWRILSDVAERLGYADQFSYTSAADIFREHAALSGFENKDGRAFNISGLESVSDEDFDAMTPVQWPVTRASPGTARMFNDGVFATPSKRARFIQVTSSSAASATSDEWPMVLNTGRVRDQWHTMTRTGLSQRLGIHITEPFAEIHPNDAARYGIRQRGLVRLTTRHGTAVVRADVTDRCEIGCVFVPIHWTAENSSLGRVGALVHEIVDPVSGQPDSKATPVRIAAEPATHFGFVLTVDKIAAAALNGAAYWSRAKVAEGYLTAFAFHGSNADAETFAEGMTNVAGRISLADSAVGTYRIATFNNNAIERIVFVGTDAAVKPSAWLIACLNKSLDVTERRCVLAGLPPDGVSNDGPIVCVCHQVPSGVIQRAIAGGCSSAEAVGRACSAGTNCGSCLPDIHRMIAALASPSAHTQHKILAAASELKIEPVA